MTTNQQWVTTTGRVVFHLRARAAFFNTITFKIGMATARRRDLSIHYSIWTPSFFNPTKKNVCSTAAACRLWRLYGCHTSIPYLHVVGIPEKRCNYLLFTFVLETRHLDDDNNRKILLLLRQ